MTTRLIIIAGPTCSGKSALALHLARHLPAGHLPIAIINADAMQCYRELRIVTARPTAAEEAATPHALYGIRPATSPATAAWWATAAHQAIADATQAGRTPVLCGGTGLYLHALLHGIAPVPDPGEPARTEARTLLAALGPAGLHARLAAEDPATAARLRPTDSQRIARAWEVWRGTGTSLATWQARPAPTPPPPLHTAAIVLNPDRPTLRAAITERWHAMLAQGAAAEVAALLDQNLPPDLPILRAHGVPELAAMLQGRLTPAQAAAAAISATARYTKRQATWLRHHPIAPDPLTFKIDARWLPHTQLTAKSMAGLIDFLSSPD